MADVLLTRTPTVEEAAMAEIRQREDDLLREANRIYRAQLADAVTWIASDYEDHSRADLVREALGTLATTLASLSALPIVGGHARLIREQHDQIQRHQQTIRDQAAVIERLQSVTNALSQQRAS